MIAAAAAARKGPEGKYPLHYLVWHNRHRELEKEVRAGQVSAPSGRGGDPAAGHARPPGVGRGRGACCPASPASLQRLFVHAAASVIAARESGGCSPSPAPLRGGRAPHTCPGPARTRVGDTVLLLRRGRGGFGAGPPARSESHVVGESAPFRHLPGECAEVGKAGGGRGSYIRIREQAA